MYACAEVNIYSARKQELIKPLLKQFTEQTGIKVNLVTGAADALIERLLLEGKHTPADLLLTTDVARLHRAKTKGLLKSFTLDSELERVPSQYRDSDNTWLGLSLRSRVIVYNPNMTSASELSTYEDLANEKWQKKICIRSSNNVYNQSLVSSVIAANGEEQTYKWLQKFVQNFARNPKGGDRDQIKAVAIGVCPLAVVNTYYLAGMQHSADAKISSIADEVKVFWPNQDGRGAHMNVSGIALLKYAQHQEEATQLMRYLVSDEAQQWYADVNYEYPVVDSIPVPESLQQWGEFKADTLPLERLGELNSQAVMNMDRAGWR